MQLKNEGGIVDLKFEDNELILTDDIEINAYQLTSFRQNLFKKSIFFIVQAEFGRYENLDCVMVGFPSFYDFTI